MKVSKLSKESKQMLVGKRIIYAGDDYITIEDGMRIYLDESEIEHIRSEPMTIESDTYLDGDDDF